MQRESPVTRAPSVPKTFDVQIRVQLDAATLDAPSSEELEAADDEGYLGGNRYYRDLRGWGWDDVRDALKIEGALIKTIAAAADPAAAEEAFEELRGAEDDDAEGLWGLDVGVAAAVLALSALGGIPFMSCNGGSFGKQHPAAHPYVAFYLGAMSPELVGELARATGVGLGAQDGVARLYARSVRDFHRFAALALERSGSERPAS